MRYLAIFDPVLLKKFKSLIQQAFLSYMLDSEVMFVSFFCLFLCSTVLPLSYKSHVDLKQKAKKAKVLPFQSITKNILVRRIVCVSNSTCDCKTRNQIKEFLLI